jgi:hypothetical protein
MKRIALVLLFVGSVMGFLSQCLSGDEGEYAPPDAFVGGSSRPYYGSLNPWNRCFFGDIDKKGRLQPRGGDLRLYGRRGQRQMLDILEGRVDDAVKYCEELLASDPTVKFEIVSIDNETINSITIPLSEMSHGTGGKGVVYIDGKAVKSKDIVVTKND